MVSNSNSTVLSRRSTLSSLQTWKIAAGRCSSPAQFRRRLNRLRSFIPFKHFLCVWGYPSDNAIHFVFNHGFPEALLRWYLTKKLIWRGAMYREWLRTNRSQVSSKVWIRRKKYLDPNVLEQAEKYNAMCLLAGGIKSRGLSIFCVMSMDSDETCRVFLKHFESVIPVLAQEFRRACSRPLLSNREATILEHRTLGKIPKEIARDEGISEGTVREHLQNVKRKLFTNDLVNAVVIAIRNGMLIHTRTEQDDA